MAGRTIDVKLNVRSNTDEETAKLKKLNKEKNIAESKDYGVARSAVGTGAASRDFAQQAQGLGGIVRLYATVAANTFAVTAAFSALSKAADTTNMIKGLDQLSASSGLALGTTARNFVKATDGAVSMREAIEATTKASAAGLGQEQIAQIAQIAKKASQALGVDMTDAVSRLTRGIVKLEPELLDELGLFTKVGKSTEDYARSIGKTANSLTDFERRQAFATAVLAEGNKKFSEIQLDANPYSKLAASLTNLSQVALETFNKVLTPLIKLFADNSGLLAAAMSVVAGKLVSMALPALGQWRKGVKAAAEDAKTSADEIVTSFGEKFTERTIKALKIPVMERELASSRKQLLKVEKDFIKDRDEALSSSLISKRSGIYTYLSQQGDSLENFTKKQLSSLKGIITRAEKAGTTSDVGMETLKRLRDRGAQIIELREKTAKQEEELSRVDAKLYGDTRYGSQEWQRINIAKKASRKADRLNILAETEQAAKEGGFGEGMATLREKLADNKTLNGIDRLRTRLVGTFLSAASAVTTFVNAFSWVGSAVAAAVAVFQILDSVFSKNSQELSKFNDSMVELSAAGTLAKDTMQKVNNEFVNSANLIASANAFKAISDSITTATEALYKVDKAANFWDRTVDLLKQPFGQDIQSSFSKNMAFAISNGIGSISDEGARKTLEGKLKSTLNVKDLSFENLNEAIANLSEKDIVKIFRDISKGFESASKSASRSAAELNGVNEAFKALEVSGKNLMNSLLPGDVLSKFGMDLMSLGTKMAEAFKDPKNAAAALREILEDPAKFNLLPAGAQQEIRQYKDSISLLSSELQGFKSSLEKDKARLVEVQKFTDLKNWNVDPKVRADYRKEEKQLQDRIGRLEVNVTVRNSELSKISDSMSKVMLESLTEGLKLVERNIAVARQEASISYRRTLLSGLSGPGIAQEQANLKIEEINVRERNNDIIYQLNETMLRNNMIGDLTNALLAIQNQKNLMELPGAQIDENLLKISAQTVKDLVPMLAGKIGPPTAEMGVVGQMYATQFRTLQAGRQAQKVKAAGEARGAREEGDQGERKAKDQETLRRNAATLERLKLEQKIFDLGIQGYDVLSDEILRAKQLNDIKIQEQDIGNKTLAIDQQIADANERQQKYKKETGEENKNIAKAIDALKATKEAQTKQNELLDKELKVRQEIERIRNKQVWENKQITNRNAIDSLNVQIKEQQLNNEQELFSLKNSYIQVSAREAFDQNKVFETGKLRLEIEKSTLDLLQKQAQERKALEDRKALPGADIDILNEEGKLLAARQSVEQKLQDTVVSGKKQKLEFIESTYYQQQKFTDYFIESFSKMGDAIADFARTGKLDFNSLISDMIYGFIKLQMQMQMNEMMGGPGGFGKAAGSFMASALGYGPYSLDGMAQGKFLDSLTAQANANAAAGFPQAKGGAWDSGVQKFARGGMFTNSIVTSPTLFKFAKGTGLMGEAGPEAIMPLKRDSKGNLGVRTTQQQPVVDVVVNNYSSQQATTKETTDAKGNRRIEVIVGEMSASSIATPGSSSQRALKSNYGLTPALVRR